MTEGAVRTFLAPGHSSKLFNLTDAQDKTLSASCAISATRIYSFRAPSALEHSTAMRGHFSIEWMAQSSQAAETEAEPTACGTHAESLPGFYCRPKFEASHEQEENRSQSLDSFSEQQTSLSIQGSFSPLLKRVLKPILVIC